MSRCPLYYWSTSTRRGLRPTISRKEEMPIEVGDRVLVTFNDEPGRQHTIVINRDGTDPAVGIYSMNHPIGKALLGAMVEDEIPFTFGENVRTATVLGIEKPSHSN